MLNHLSAFIKPQRLPDLLTQNQEGPKLKEPKQLTGHLGRGPLLRNMKLQPWFSALQNAPLSLLHSFMNNRIMGEESHKHGPALVAERGCLGRQVAI